MRSTADKESYEKGKSSKKTYEIPVGKIEHSADYKNDETFVD